MALNFPPGSTASQPFTIRVYDDASVNGTRNVTLGFTVNAGGGNAVAGDGRTAFNMIINDNDVAPSGPQTVSSRICAKGGYLWGPFDLGDIRTRPSYLFMRIRTLRRSDRILPGKDQRLSLNIAKFSGSAFVHQGTTFNRKRD